MKKPGSRSHTLQQALFILTVIHVLSFGPVIHAQTQGRHALMGASYSIPQSEDEISAKNWQQNPKIISIRKIVNSDNAGVRTGAFKTEHRICEQGYFSRLRIARDSKGVVRWYQHYQEGEDSSWDDNYYYDDAGRLRFVLMTSYAINATREQHRAYYDESGHLIYHGRRILKGPGYFGPQVEDFKEFVRMDPSKDFAEVGEGCKVITTRAKHVIKKSE